MRPLLRANRAIVPDLLPLAVAAPSRYPRSSGWPARPTPRRRHRHREQSRGYGATRRRSSGRTAAATAGNRDRGEPRGPTPPTPPYVRVRIRRFGGLGGMAGRQGREAERGEVGVGQGDGERRAVAEPPRAVGAAGGFRPPRPSPPPGPRLPPTGR